MTIPAAVAAVALTAAVVAAQEPADRPTFEVASIKPVKSADAANRLSIEPGGRFRFSNITLKQLMGTAYQRMAYDNREIVGGPDWTDTDRFEVLAQARGELVDAAGFPTRVFAMMRALLEERFQLKVHEDKRERSVYTLQLGRGDRALGPRLKPSTTDCAAVMRDEANGKPPKFEPGQMRPCAVGVPPGRLMASAVTMDAFARVVGGFVGRPVVDRTGLGGVFDVDIEFSPEFRPGFLPPEPGAAAPAPSDKPSLFTALQEQLGLKLVSDRVAIDVLVIDHAERPTPD